MYCQVYSNVRLVISYLISFISGPSSWSRSMSLSSQSTWLNLAMTTTIVFVCVSWLLRSGWPMGQCVMAFEERVTHGSVCYDFWWAGGPGISLLWQLRCGWPSGKCFMAFMSGWPRVSVLWLLWAGGPGLVCYGFYERVTQWSVSYDCCGAGSRGISVQLGQSCDVCSNLNNFGFFNLLEVKFSTLALTRWPVLPSQVTTLVVTLVNNTMQLYVF